MIRHSLAEGWLLIKQRVIVSLLLALSLAVPICLGGVTLAAARWLAPITELNEEESVVPVLLHPQMDVSRREEWIRNQETRHPDWQLRLLPPEQLAERLSAWFPYLASVFDEDGGAFLPPLVEIQTQDVTSLDILESSPAVIAIGPRSSVHQAIGGAAEDFALLLGLLSGILLASAAALAAVWVHLEVYRHSDEITIMRLIGATEAAIRGPFFIALVAPGVVAAVLSGAGSTFVAKYASDLTQAIGLPPVEVDITILAVQCAIAVLLPLFVGALTLSRHAYLEME